MLLIPSLSRIAVVALAFAMFGAAASAILYVGVHAHAQGPALDPCDWNSDGRVDLVDIQAIRANIGMSVIPAGGKGDPTGDGIITVNDVRACTLRCTNPKCAP